jgi:ADP-heptose:LPS heptosyltransferase
LFSIPHFFVTIIILRQDPTRRFEKKRTRIQLLNLKDLQYRYGLSKTVINVIVLLHSMFIYLFDALLFLMPKRGKKGEIPKLLVIKLDAIGDFILWLDFAKGLRELYPPATHEVVLLANRAWADFAGGTPFFDRILPVERMRFILNPLYRLRTLLNIRRQGFDIVIDPSYSREFQYSPAVARVSGAPKRLAPEGDEGIQRPWQKKISDGWYSRLFPSSPGQLMEMRRNAEFLRALGYRDFKARMPVYLPKHPAPLNTREPYYVFFPGAGWINRQWPIEKFSALATLIHKATGWSGVICGGPGEEWLARQLQEMAEAPLDNKVGQTTLDELGAIIASARFLVGNETSAVHLAAAVSTPAVCILGGGHFGRFFPYQPEAESDGRPVPINVWHRMACFSCNWHCIYPIVGTEPVPCIAGISIEDVWDKIQECIRMKNPEKAFNV